MIDKKLSESILNKYNNKQIGREAKTLLQNIPKIDNMSIIDFSENIDINVSEDTLNIFFKEYTLPSNLKQECVDNGYKLNEEILTKIGIHLYPYFSYGVLNGGSATSYVDYKKNRSFNEELFSNLSDTFKELAPEYRGKAKGITPAFINKDNKPGPSFMELKMRSLLLEAKKYKKLTGKNIDNLFPVFQMTSTTNSDSIMSFYNECNNSIYLKSLIKETNINITSVYTAKQPLITAYTHSKFGEVKDYFKDTNGNYLALPGGHGQCFQILKDIFLELYKKGIRFISIGNVDNIGYTLDPKALAILAITGKQATFDFSFKTEFDVKGGILIKDQNNRLTCADLGVSVSKEDVRHAEKNGVPILFNCATGLFNLKYLIDNIDFIINTLPTRFTDQNKDIGLYSQAEQVTWEIINILDDFMILAVDKYKRFLASKLLIENLATSGFVAGIKNDRLKKCAIELNKGLVNLLENTFNLKLDNGVWKIND